LGGNVGKILFEDSFLAPIQLNYVSCNNDFQIAILPGVNRNLGGNVGLATGNNKDLKNILAVNNTFPVDTNVDSNAITGNGVTISQCSQSGNTNTNTIRACTQEADNLSCYVAPPSCTQQLCGNFGVCLPNSGYCVCQSSYEPSEDLISCQASQSCNGAPQYSNTDYLSDEQILGSTEISFQNGKLVVSKQFGQVQNVWRNLKILSLSGDVCKEMIDNVNQTNSLSQLEWFQSVDSSNGNTQCKDQIDGKFGWSEISNCLSSSNPNLFEGIIVSVSNLEDVQYEEGGFSKKQQQQRAVTVFENSQNFSINFETSFTMYSSDISFVYESPAGDKKVFFKLLSRKFSTTNLNLVVVYQVNISTPLALGEEFTFTSNNSLQADVLVGTEDCTSGDYCVQQLTITYDLSQQDCQGISERVFSR
jgi:hypothetical protein